MEKWHGSPAFAGFFQGLARWKQQSKTLAWWTRSRWHIWNRIALGDRGTARSWQPSGLSTEVMWRYVSLRSRFALARTRSSRGQQLQTSGRFVSGVSSERTSEEEHLGIVRECPRERISRAWRDCKGATTRTSQIQNAAPCSYERSSINNKITSRLQCVSIAESWLFAEWCHWARSITSA